jgi:hypothetical protein
VCSEEIACSTCASRGLRPGEGFALRRSDISSERDVIVQRKLVWKRDGFYSII